MPSIRRCVFGCLTTDVTIHSFPHPKKFPERFRVWLNLAGDSLTNYSNDYIYKNKRVCAKHFTDDAFNRNNRLSALAVPTLHLPDQRVKEQSNHEDDPGTVIDKSPSGDLSDNSYEGIDLTLTPNPVKDVTLNSELFSWNKQYETVPQTEKQTKRIHKEFREAEDEDVLIYEEIRQSTGQRNKDILNEKQTKGTRKEFREAEDMLIYEEIRQSTDERNKDMLTEPASPLDDKCMEFNCNLCQTIIAGFRYTCVQCPDFDLCVACELRGAHAAHYVLRVPALRPYEEVQSVLESIRRFFENKIFLKPHDGNASLHESVDSELEIKEEVKEVDPLNAPIRLDPTEGTEQEREVEEYNRELAMDVPAQAVVQELQPLDLFQDSATYLEEEYLEDLEEDSQMESQLHINDAGQVDYLEASDEEFEIEIQVQDDTQNEDSGNLDSASATELPLEDVLNERGPLKYIKHYTRKRKFETHPRDSTKNIEHARDMLFDASYKLNEATNSVGFKQSHTQQNLSDRSKR